MTFKKKSFGQCWTRSCNHKLVNEVQNIIGQKRKFQFFKIFYSVPYFTGFPDLVFWDLWSMPHDPAKVPSLVFKLLFISHLGHCDPLEGRGIRLLTLTLSALMGWHFAAPLFFVIKFCDDFKGNFKRWANQYFTMNINFYFVLWWFQK